MNSELTGGREFGIGDFFGGEAPREFLGRLLTRPSLPPTLLFSGPGGLGKALAAFLWIKALVCENNSGRGFIACDECRTCRSLNTLNQPDFVAVRPRSTEITITQIRDDYDSFRNAYLLPHNLPYRLFLLEECHLLNEEVSNMMLKLLEEPPERTLFILVTDKPYLLLPTIRSRALEVRFPPEPTDRLAQYVRSRGADEAQAQLAAYFSQGRVGLARQLLLSHDFLPALAAAMARIAHRLQGPVTAGGLFAFREPLLELARVHFDIALKVEEGEVPADFYLLPWRRPRDDEPESTQVPSLRRNALERASLQFILDCLKLALLKAEEESGKHLASAAEPVFTRIRSQLEVNLRLEQVVDYLLIRLADARI